MKIRKIAKIFSMISLCFVIVTCSVFGTYKKAYAIEWVALWTAEEVIFTLLGILGITWVGAEAIEHPDETKEATSAVLVGSILDYVDTGKFAEANQTLNDNKEYVMENMRTWLDEIIEHGMYYGELVVDTRNACWSALKAWVQDLLGASEIVETPEKIHEALPENGNTDLTQTIFEYLPYLTTANMQKINAAYADTNYNAVAIYKIQNASVTHVPSYVGDGYPCEEYIYFVSAYYVPEGGKIEAELSGTDNILLKVLDAEGTQIDSFGMYANKGHDIVYRVDISTEDGKPIFSVAPDFGHQNVAIQTRHGTRLENGVITSYGGGSIWYDLVENEGAFIYSTVPVNGMIVRPEQTLLPDWVGQLKTGEAVDQLIHDKTYVDNYDIVVSGQSDIAWDEDGTLVVGGELTIPVQDIPEELPDEITIPGVIPVDVSDGTTIEDDLPVEDVIETPIETPDEVNGQRVQYSGLTTVFPFCIPFDLIRCFQLLNASPTPPEWRYTLRVDSINFEYTFVINFDSVRPLVLIFRTFILLSFIVSLILATRALIKG